MGNNMITFWAEGQPIVVPSSPVLNAMLQADGTWTAELPATQTSTVTICSKPATTSSGDSGVATVVIVGCKPKLCAYIDSGACALDKRCEWLRATETTPGKCGVSSCTTAYGNDKTACNNAPRCYWDVTEGKCFINAAGCSALTTTECTSAENMDKCAIVQNMCVNAPTCNNYPDVLTCNGDHTCAWGENTGCHDRLCGYDNFDDCSIDSYCAWSNNKCNPIGCITETIQSVCTSDQNCEWNDLAIPRCAPKSCTYTTSQLCLADPTCAWLDDSQECVKNVCDSFDNVTCSTEPDLCQVRQIDQKCVRKSCSAPTMEQCEEDANCIWGAQTVAINGVAVTREICTARTFSNLRAATDDVQCTLIEKDRSLLMILLIALTAVLLLSFSWIYYRQRVAMAANKRIGFNDDTDNGFSQPLYEQPSSYEAPQTFTDEPLQSSYENNNNNNNHQEEEYQQEDDHDHHQQQHHEMTEEEQLDAL